MSNPPKRGHQHLKESQRTPPEVFKPVPGYEDRYEVSNRGTVRGLKRGAICRHYIRKSGVATVCLSAGVGKVKTFSVLRLIALAFVPNPDPANLTIAINRTGNHSDLTPQNVFWGTSAQSAALRLKHNPGFAAHLKRVGFGGVERVTPPDNF